MQTIAVGLETGIAALGTDEHGGVHKNVVGIEFECLLRHCSECEVGELGLFLFREFVHLARHPDAKQEVNKFFTLKSVLL